MEIHAIYSQHVHKGLERRHARKHATIISSVIVNGHHMVLGVALTISSRKNRPLFRRIRSVCVSVHAHASGTFLLGFIVVFEHCSDSNIQQTFIFQHIAAEFLMKCNSSKHTIRLYLKSYLIFDGQLLAHEVYCPIVVLLHLTIL